MTSACEDPRSSRAKILVVDDMPLNLRLLEELLDPEEYEVLQTDRGETALRIVERESPDVILLDVMMPVMDGYEVCSYLKSSPQWRDIPVIIITALNETSDYVKAMQCGADDFMSKPFNQTVLQARIRAYVHSYRTGLALRHQERFRYDLLRMVAHDLNNHMGAVMGYIELLLTSDMPDTMAKRVRKAMGSAVEAARLLRNFMGIEKMESGQVDLQMSDVNVRQVVTRTIETREVLWRDRGLSMHVEIPESVCCRADEALLGRVLQNLIDNAIRYCQPDSRIDVSGDTDDSCVSISIINQSDVIDRDSLGHIFDRFYQIKSRPEHSRGGSGLGLAFCKMAVESMGGSIAAISPIPGCDNGVEMNFRLPRAETAESGDQKVGSTASAGCNAGVFNRYLTPPGAPPPKT